jgi:hypothetical protein
MPVTNQMRQRILLGGALTLFVVLLLSVPLIVSVNGQPVPPPNTSPPSSNCAQTVHFYRYDVNVDNNGPAAPADPNNVGATVAELITRLGNDPALMAQVQGYIGGAAMSTQSLLDATNAFMANTQNWCDTLSLIVAGLAQCSASITEMSGPYQTWYQQATQPVPSSYSADPDRPSYTVLRFSCPNGQQYNFKLDCGFQPVGQFPPAAPPEGPPPSQPVAPPCTTNCGPPTTTPPNTTTTTSVCPPQGCKPYVPPAPHQCADPAQPCQPGQGPAIPNPPDPVKPSITVTPPSSVLPPPAPTVAPRPTHTATVPLPTSVPS